MRALLEKRSVAYEQVVCSDYGSPQSRKRIIAGPRRLLQHLKQLQTEISPMTLAQVLVGALKVGLPRSYLRHAYLYCYSDPSRPNHRQASEGGQDQDWSVAGESSSHYPLNHCARARTRQRARTYTCSPCAIGPRALVFQRSHDRGTKASGGTKSLLPSAPTRRASGAPLIRHSRL